MKNKTAPKSIYNVHVEFNIDGQYVWKLIAGNHAPTFSSKQSYRSEDLALSAACDFAAKHQLGIGARFFS